MHFAFFSLVLAAAAVPAPAPGSARASAAAPVPAAAPAHPADWAPPVLSPKEEAATFQLPPGYHVELVLSDPQIREPVWISFDGNGRMYVVEMRSYMQDVDGKSEFSPVGRISRHDSSRGDGVFDVHHVYADHLTLPRMILPLDRGQALVGLTNTGDLTLYQDPKDTGTAQSHSVWFSGGPETGNLEHQPSGLIWSLDNWIYTTRNTYRLRWQPNGPPLKGATSTNGGQWGLTQDDQGKLWVSSAGGEKALLHFQTHILYASIDAASQNDGDFPEVWPAIGLADFQGGLIRVRQPDQTLNHFTACAGEEVYRGDSLPAELRGNIFIGEPVGRLVRRAVVEVRDGITHVRNPYEAEKGEFLRSTDPYFRPVDIANGPDGCLYIVDMYRGIIQEGNWTRPGSYLRPVILQHKMDETIGHGRIWRVVYDGIKPAPFPHLLDESPSQLAAELDQVSGWRRDMAQRLLVLRQAKAVAPKLQSMALKDSNPLGRLDAAWTLEGLGRIDRATVTDFLKDSNPELRAAGMRLFESLSPTDRQTLQATVLKDFNDADPTVALQAIMTAQRLQLPNWQALATQVVKTSTSAGVKEIGQKLMTPQDRFVKTKRTPQDIAILHKGQEIYDGLCFACHGHEGTGAPVTEGSTLMMAPDLTQSPIVRGPVNGVLQVLLHGLSGPDHGTVYAGQVMVSMADNPDEWIANVLSFVRDGLGGFSDIVTPAQVAAQRKAVARPLPWTREELHALILPPAIAGTSLLQASTSDRPQWEVTATGAEGAIDYRTSAPQTKGQWVSFELPEATLLAGMSVDSGPDNAEFPRGFQVEVSQGDGKWKSVYTGKGSANWTYAGFAPVEAKQVKVTITDTTREGWFWKVAKVAFYAPQEGQAAGAQGSQP